MKRKSGGDQQGYVPTPKRVMAKVAILRRLRTLLDTNVAGATTPWELLQQGLCEMNIEQLTALHYRIERALATSYDEGAKNTTSVTEDCK